MARIRLEFIPIEWLALGWLGFDHLQIVYEPDGGLWPVAQDDWYVLEGTYSRSQDCVTLGVAGVNGHTTLAVANGAKGRALERLIGTPEARGSVVLPISGDPFLAWQAMAALARDLDQIGHRYSLIGLVLPGHPVVNSSSVIASLLWRIGIDIHDYLPAGAVFLPGTATLLGASNPNSLKLHAPHFDTVMGGCGDDVLTGSSDLGGVGKLYGGSGNDTFLWTPGRSMIHGGEPCLPRAADGFDSVDYRGAGRIEVAANARRLGGRCSDYVVTFSGLRVGRGGINWLTSIEALYLDPETDTLVAGSGLANIPRSLAIDMRPVKESQSCGRADFSAAGRGLSVVSAGDDDVEMTLGAGDRAWRFTGLRALTGSAYDDHIQMSRMMRVAEGGGGDDVIDARLVAPGGASSTYGYDAEVDGGPGDDVLIACSGRTFARGGPGRDTFIVAALGKATELVIADATPLDCLLIPAALFCAEEQGRATRLRRLRGSAHGAIPAVCYERDGADLVIRLTGRGPAHAAAGQAATNLGATVRVLNFRAGDLGIDAAG